MFVCVLVRTNSGECVGMSMPTAVILYLGFPKEVFYTFLTIWFSYLSFRTCHLFLVLIYNFWLGLMMNDELIYFFGLFSSLRVFLYTTIEMRGEIFYPYQCRVIITYKRAPD